MHTSSQESDQGRRARRRRIAVLALAALLGLPRPAPAQLSALSSLAQPGAGPADGAEPWSAVLNPASLVEARGWLVGLRDSEVASGTSFLGSGTGLYAAHPLPYLSSFAVGGGLELLRPGGTLPGLGGKLTLALAYRLFPQLSVGLSYAHLFAATAAPSYNGLDTVSLGARLTVGRFLAMGLVLHDLSAPTPSDPGAAPVERSYELELALRPIGDHRLELAAGARVGESSHLVWPRARLWVRPLPGLGIGAETTLALQADRPAAPLDYRVGVGLELSFANVGASGFALFGSGGSGGVGLHGGSAAVRFSVESYPTLWAGPGRIYKVELGNKSGDAMLRLLADLRALETNPRARAVVVVANGLRQGWGTADELRDALGRLRRAGRRVVVYGADLSQRELYVASAAERIYLDPMGSVSLGGIAVGNFFVKEALDSVGIRADLVRIGDYKASPEMWTRNEPTAPAQKQRQAVLDDLFQRLVGAVAEGRRLARPDVEKLIESGLFPARRALAAGLVDAIATGEQLEESLAALLGEQLPFAVPDRGPEHPTSHAPPGVAVLHIDGDLTEGRSQRVPFVDIRLSGGQTLSDALVELGRNGQVRAVVIRVDSPGGSALVADVLARQVAELARSKPVICSFGDVAASGGYYLAAPCTLIYTNPSTTTGSIGIFGGKVDVSGLLAMLGVHRVTEKRGGHADLESPYRPYTDEERQLVLDRLRQGYDRFLDTVARGRHMTPAEVDGRARGRIWSGQQAVRERLCDRTGGLMDAVAEAERRADLPVDRAPIFYYPQVAPTLLNRLLGLAPDLVAAPADRDAPALPGLGRLTAALGSVVPALKVAFGLLGSDVLMRLEGDPAQ